MTPENQKVHEIPDSLPIAQLITRFFIAFRETSTSTPTPTLTLTPAPTPSVSRTLDGANNHAKYAKSFDKRSAGVKAVPLFV